MKRILVAIVAFGVLTGAAEARRVPWCGSYARSHLVNSDPGARFNLACNWRHYGSATYAHEGADEYPGHSYLDVCMEIMRAVRFLLLRVKLPPR
jgi:hypothetical protein